MRKIADFIDERQAEVFSDYLYTQAIRNHCEKEPDARWAIWVEDEDDLPRARNLLDQYRAWPEAEQFRAAPAAARDRAREENAQAQARARNLFDRDRLWPEASGRARRPLTLALIALSVLVALATDFGQNPQAVNYFSIARYTSENGAVAWYRGLVEVRHGQVWRLVTPIFLHFGIMHLLFNMMWLYDLGGGLERGLGSWRLGLMVLVLAVIPNLAQFLMSGPHFGGMSGVVFGLLGYVWIRGRLDPGCGLRLHPSTAAMMLIWLLLGFTGLLGGMANYVHGAGAVIGVAWGFFAARWHER